jgi:hypothetical protein
MNPSVLRVVVPTLLGTFLLAAPASARVECESARAGIISRQARQHAVIQRCHALRKAAETSAPATPVAGIRRATPAASLPKPAAPVASTPIPTTASAVSPAR